MKKLIILFFALIVTNQGYSQMLRVGLKTGFTYANIREQGGNSETDYEAIPGFKICLSTRTKVSNSFSILIEPGLSKKGFQMNHNSDSDVKTKTSLSYLTLPVLLSYKPKNINLFLGLEYNRLISQETENPLTGPASTYYAYSKNSLELVTGVEYYVINKIPISFYIYHGITPMEKTTDQATNPKDELYNYGRSCTIGYIFN